MNSKNVSNCNLQSDNSHNVHLCIFDVLCWSVPVFCVISILKSCLVTLTIILYPNVFFVMTCSLGVQRLFSSCVWSYALSLSSDAPVRSYGFHFETNCLICLNLILYPRVVCICYIQRILNA